MLKYVLSILYFTCFLTCKDQQGSDSKKRDKQLEEEAIKLREQLQKIKEKDNTLYLKKKLIKEKQELLAPFENTLNEADNSFLENAAIINMRFQYPKWQGTIEKYKKAKKQLDEINQNKNISFTKNERSAIITLASILKRNIAKLEELNRRIEGETGFKNRAVQVFTGVISLGYIPLYWYIFFGHHSAFRREFGRIDTAKDYEYEERYPLIPLENIDMQDNYNSRVKLINQEKTVKNMCIAPDIAWGFKRLMLIANMRDQLDEGDLSEED